MNMARGILGWGLPALLLVLAGSFSTILNGLQILNGLFCFSLVTTTTSVSDADISSFAISGYTNNHFITISDMCPNFSAYNAVEPFPFCVDSVGGIIRCTQSVKESRVYYKYILDVNCIQTKQLNGNTFQMTVSPGSASLRGVVANETGYFVSANVEVRRCQLNHAFYLRFAVVCSAITLFIFLARALMRTTLVEPVSFRLSNSKWFYWLYEVFERNGFFSFFNPYKNEPYLLIKYEKFYIMESKASVDVEAGYVEEPCLRSFTWSTSDSVYKFNYDVESETVFAYSKDNLGFEKLKEKVTDRRVVAEIRKYLQLKSESACILTEDKNGRHFLSLGDVYSLAIEGSRLAEKSSDKEYRLYNKRRESIPISSRASQHPETDNPTIPLRVRNSQNSSA